MSVLFWSVLSTVAWVVLGTWIGIAKRNSIHIGTIFAYLFVLNYPLKLIATEFRFAVIDSSHYGAEWQLYALLLANVSALFFFLPLLLFTGKVQYSAIAEPSSARSIGWLWLIGYLALIFYSYGTDAASRLLAAVELRELISLRGEGRVGSALSALASQAARVCLIVFCFSIARNFKYLTSSKKIFLVVGYCLVAYALLGMSGSKNLTLQPLATFVLASGWIACAHGRSWPLKRMVTIGTVGLCLIFIAGYVRSFPDEHTEFPEGRFVYAATQLAAAFDAPDNLTLILYRMNDVVWGDMQYQPTLFNLLYSNIPRAIWSDKPLLHANQQIMAEYLHERFTDYTGEVLAPSMAGELIASGGIVFMVPMSILLGLLFAFLYQKAHSSKTNFFFLVTYVWLALNVFNLLRSGTAIIAPLWVFCGVTFIILKLTGKLSEHKNNAQFATDSQYTRG